MRSQTRRGVLAMAAAGVGASLLPTGGANALPLRLPPGVQLWTVKEEMAKDFAGTLRALKTLGYQRVESAGWHGRSARDFRAAVADAGLDCASAHYSLSDLLTGTEAKLAFAKEVGARFCIASSPAPSRPLPQGREWNLGLAEAMTLADWRSNAAAMNRIGAQAKALGLRFGYHNHAAEFMTYEGVQAFDELVRMTDPALVDIELDIGWVAAAGYNPVDVLRRHAPRIRLLHVKDIATRERRRGQIAQDMRTTPIGSGTIAWPAVFAAAARAPIDSYFVEQEPPFTEAPLAALRSSMAYLTRLPARPRA